MIPLGFISMFIALNIEATNMSYWGIITRRWEAKKNYGLSFMRSFKTIVSFSFITNLLSCFILGLVIRSVRRVVMKVKVEKDEADKKNKMNVSITSGHIIVTASFTLSQMLSLILISS